MVREKETRKELLEEPDVVTVYLHRTANFLVTHKRRIITGLAVFLVVIMSVSGYVYYQSRAENAASALFARAMTNYGTALAANGSFTEFEAVKDDFRDIMNNYGKTKAADLTLVQYASVCYRSGDLERAVEHYKKALNRLPRDHTFRELAVSGLGYAYEELQDYPSAIKHFTMIAENPSAATRDHALFKLGELYMRIDEPDKSRQSYEKIVTAHKGSIYHELAKSKLH